MAFRGAGDGIGDLIDVSGVDADHAATDDQDFVFGTATGRGRLWAASEGANTVIRGNSDGDAAAEFELLIEDGLVRASAYTEADFILV